MRNASGDQHFFSLDFQSLELIGKINHHEFLVDIEIYPEK
jgi:hypothetical protein